MEELDLFTVANDPATLESQDRELSRNITEALSLPMPPELPIISLRSDIDSFEDDERATHQRQRDAHLQRLGADTRQITPAGSDHLDIAYHRDHVAVIANEVAQLLERVRK